MDDWKIYGLLADREDSKEIKHSQREAKSYQAAGLDFFVERDSFGVEIKRTLTIRFVRRD